MSYKERFVKKIPSLIPTKEEWSKSRIAVEKALKTLGDKKTISDEVLKKIKEQRNRLTY